MDRLKSMKEQLISIVQGQLTNVSDVDAKELGEAVDMIKDLAEATYYCAITEAMEEGSESKEKKNYYDKEQMYYNSPSYGQPMYYPSEGGHMYYTPSRYTPSRVNPVYYGEREYLPEQGMYHDPREGRARQSRRMYMESKEMHKDQSTKMKELDKYIKDLSDDIIEMIEGSTPEEKQVLQQKIATLATKIV